MELQFPGSEDAEGFVGGDAWRGSKMARTVSSDAHIETCHRSSDASTGMCLVNGVKGPFTLSQWLELEHQALIYRYITANQPIPIQLLIPIRKAFESAGFYGGFNGGWGPFHLGYSNSTDPEPGRCRRTDGKKWRCAKEAVENQKYCDKHINRGRHRSRKHVECQTTKSSTTKSVLGCGSSKSFDRNQNIQGKNLQPTGSNRDTNTSLNRMISGSYGSYTKIFGDPKEPESQDSLFTLDNWPIDNHISADFMSSSSSPNNETVSLTSQWETSMGGPLAEALQSRSTSNNADESMKNSAMTLSPTGWEGNGTSQLYSSSPNVVLQMSYCSTGSSPRADMYDSVT